MGRSLGEVWVMEGIRSGKADLCSQFSGYNTYLLFPLLIWLKPKPVNQGRTKISSTCLEGIGTVVIITWKGFGTGGLQRSSPGSGLGVGGL